MGTGLAASNRRRVVAAHRNRDLPVSFNGHRSKSAVSNAENTKKSAVEQAKADMTYLGWDFGSGFGVGIGPVPSAYGYHYCGFTATNRPCY
jgi:hypothetical protein